MGDYVHRLGIVVKVLTEQINEIEGDLQEIVQREVDGDDDDVSTEDACRLLELQNALSALRNPLGGELGTERRVLKERNAATQARWAREAREEASAQR